MYCVAAVRICRRCCSRRLLCSGGGSGGFRVEANPLNGAAYDEVIDVRTQAEYAEDHLPGAVSLPLLGDSDRHVVGRTFAESPFAGRRLGAAMISKKIGHLLDSHFADKELDYRPLIYCWRGGQRSQSLAIVLGQIGYSPTVLAGGYRTYRRLVATEIDRLAAGLRHVVVLAGLTGSGKTLLLGRLADSGEQVIDLESLANHKGSLLGHNPSQPAQPSQKAFESALRVQLARLNPARPVWLECESAKIGLRFVPPALAARIRDAPRVLLAPEAPPLSDRVRHLVASYCELAQQPDQLTQCLQQLGYRHHSKATVARWLAAAKAGDLDGLVAQLLADHYDPAYRHSRGRYFLETDPTRVARVRLEEGELPQLLLLPPPDGGAGRQSGDAVAAAVVERLLAARDRLLKWSTTTEDATPRPTPRSSSTAA